MASKTHQHKRCLQLRQYYRGWCEGDEVVVINGRMYRLDELESVEVTKE